MNDFLLFLTVLGVSIMVGLTLVLVPSYYSACKQAEIINKEFDTSYTCSDLFWAKDAVNSGRYKLDIYDK